MQLSQHSEDLKNSPIFVVDDEPVNLKLIERVLGTEGYHSVLSIQNPVDVSTRFREQRPNLILLDINMPRMNGFDVLERLKSEAGDALPPVIFLTAELAANHRAKAFEQGVLDFISKPFNRQELLARVRNLLTLELAHQELTQKKNNLELVVNKRTEALRRSQLQVVQVLGKAAEFRDNETGAHIMRMSNISAHLAKLLGHDDDFVQLMLNASPMHDVGKIAIPDNILLKPGKFNPDEWEIMKTHTVLGYEILKSNDSAILNLASEIALHHHEKWDGTGYPAGLAGANIPISCRIVSVSDTFDALLSQRPYKKPWPLEEATAYMFAQAGLQFDPEIIEVFKDALPDIINIRDTYQDHHSDHAQELAKRFSQAMSQQAEAAATPGEK
ncbi:MAG: HD domain-containing phosphohydrolase, partial [Pseudomonadota bacterium]